MAHDDDAHESMGGVQRGDGPGHSRPAELAPLNDHINQQILQTHRENPKLGVEGIRQQLDELGLEASPAHIADVLKKHGKL